MSGSKLTYLVGLLALFGASTLWAQKAGKLDILYADEWEFIFSEIQDTTYVSGSVIIETGTAMIYCDSAMWAKGELVLLWGRVVIDDRDYRLVADSVHYDLLTSRAVARGDYVELWSRLDSLFAVGRQAFFDRERDYFYMQERPTVYLNYPDSGRMIEVIADFVEYDAQREVAEAEGTVNISSQEFSSTSGCAVMHPRRHALDLFDSPLLRRRQSEISGRFITISSDQGMIRQVDVIDSAYAEFVEPINPLETAFDRSTLFGKRILLDFVAGDLRTVTCYGQAYSWYYPAGVHGKEDENSVSGDTIRFDVADEQLRQVDVIGGAVGTYLSSTKVQRDSTVEIVTDTIDYEADRIAYNLPDSLIDLRSHARTTAGSASLEAFRIQFDTKERIIEAYSGAVAADSVDSDNDFDKLQPNEIPVILKDENQRLAGDYLRYSIDTEKGRIVTSKSRYETGYFYGEKLYRQHEDIYYLQDGRYTTCDADEPHFHFKSDNLKLIEGKKLIARPVVLHIGRLPILAVPYYVFPLQKGRHSGILPFTLGNIERGERYIRNVGYYWAASEYWDWQGALDYFEDRDRLNIFSRLSYRKLYSFDGTISGNWGRETAFDPWAVREFRKSRWTLKAAHNHQFSPSFRISATGDVRSDPTYYNDYSANLAERLNRVIRSQVNFSGKFGKSVSISGSVKHDDFLDKESRTDHLPSLGVSLPAVRPFGSGSLDEDGKLQRHWYNELIVTYRPRLDNYSSRVTRDSTANAIYQPVVVVDTVFEYDSVSMETDTTITVNTTWELISEDTLSYRSRKEYTRVDHSVSASFPLTVARYFVFNPSFGYAENWFNIYRTDQSDALKIDASTTYRSYKYNLGASLSTTLYGTAYPNLFGLVGLRQVIKPSVSYSWVPKIDRHPIVSAYAGGTARSGRKSQSMGITLSHVYQAKVRSGETERSLELVSVVHALSYDFEKEERRFSALRTTVRSNLLKNIRLDASLTHDLYKGFQSNQLDLWNPHLTSVRVNGTLSLNGRRFLFDDIRPRLPVGADSASQLPTPGQPEPVGRKGWDMTATYSYSESGKWTGFFKKSSSIRLSLHFSLTPTTQISYSQYYDFVAGKTITNQVSIVKTLHCWTGRFHWVPTGSTRGWGFKLYVTALPAIKIDNSQSSLNSSYFQEFR